MPVAIWYIDMSVHYMCLVLARLEEGIGSILWNWSLS